MEKLLNVVAAANWTKGILLLLTVTLYSVCGPPESICKTPAVIDDVPAFIVPPDIVKIKIHVIEEDPNTVVPPVQANESQDML